jgi:hypothetical protein
MTTNVYKKPSTVTKQQTQTEEPKEETLPEPELNT